MAWYQVKGNQLDTVFSSRVRLARNLFGFGFGEKLDEKSANEVIARIEKALEGKDYAKTDMSELSSLDARSMVEKHLISREFAAKKTPHALFSNQGKSISIMACEEDHIRVQCILPGLALDEAYRFAAECDELLDEKLDIAFDERLGYLTHCPTNLGTGLRASVMLFLPALTAAGSIASLARQLSKIGLTMRGIYGEGTDSRGCLYQVSNQVTLGVTEEEILRRLGNAVNSIVENEHRLRDRVKGESYDRLCDRIKRAEGTLRYATMISSEEFYSLFADVKLGIAMGIVDSITHEDLHTLLISVMPATLTKGLADTPKNDIERDKARASFIKQAWR